MAGPFVMVCPQQNLDGHQVWWTRKNPDLRRCRSDTAIRRTTCTAESPFQILRL